MEFIALRCGMFRSESQLLVMQMDGNDTTFRKFIQLPIVLHWDELHGAVVLVCFAHIMDLIHDT